MKSIRLSDDVYEQLQRVMLDMNLKSAGDCVQALITRYSVDSEDDHAILVSLRCELRALRETLNNKKQSKRTAVQDAFNITCDETFISREAWAAWVKHLLSMRGTRINLYQAQLHMDKFRSFYEQHNLDIDELIKHLIAEGALKPYIPASWIRHLL